MKSWKVRPNLETRLILMLTSTSLLREGYFSKTWIESYLLVASVS